MASSSIDTQIEGQLRLFAFRRIRTSAVSNQTNKVGVSPTSNMADRLGLEETNRVRISLGMQPLPAPNANGASSKLNFKPSDNKISNDSDEEQGSTLDSRHALASGNWQKLQAEADEKKKREEKRAQLKKQREAAQRYTKLEGKGLGDADEGETNDTKAWLLGGQERQKKIEKERARRLARELAEREEAAGYTEKDLAGAKVGHELGDFDDETEQVLTLKDAAVDAESEDDELENVNVREKEKLRERLELKKQKPVYDPHASEDVEGKSVLAHYDEEIDGKKKKHFTLNEAGAPQGLQKGDDEDAVIPGRTMIRLDFLQEDTKPTSDYQDISEIKMKKRKQKKEKTKKRKIADDEYDDMFQTQERGGTNGHEDIMDIDADGTSEALPRRTIDDTSFLDDDDLQANLAMQRRAALKKRKRTRPEDIARELREEGSATPAAPVDTTADGSEEEGGLIIDETQQFVENLKPRAPKAKKSKDEPQDTPEIPENAEMVDPDDPYSTEASARLKREASAATAVDPTKGSHTGLEAEGTLSHGMGGTLAMLTQRGLLKTAGSGDLNAQYRERQRFLGEKQQREADAERKARLQRERDRTSGRFAQMSGREREAYAQQMNASRDQQDSRAAADMFNREYKPNVNLKYTDDFGRDMTAKEAFKHLSHQFHGKGSGKQKTEKMIKQVEEERAREARSTLDASQATGMHNAAGVTAKKNKRAGVRLQ